jgi:CIC family chloride channel protein
VSEPDHSLQLIVALFVIRLLATAVTVGGGGVGGLFVPLVVAGAITGGAVSSIVHDPADIFPLVGVAAFLGAGYRTPLAGVMFVAETTGRPGYIVPGLIASVAAQLVMGDASASPYQGTTRLGHLERRFRLPIDAAIDAEVMTVPSDATLAELYQEHLLRNRRPEVPVVDGSTYRGIVSLSDIQRVPLAEWTGHTVADVLDAGRPTIAPSATLGDAVRAMEAADVDAVAVLDGGGFVGLVTSAGIFDLEQILDQFDGGR